MRLFWILLAFAVFPALAHAEVVINEIAWMGSLPEDGESAQAAANDEWIELYNSGANAVSLDGWGLAAEDGNPNIALTGAIAGNGYFLLERGSDDVVSGVPADLIYGFRDNALSNSGERLTLKDASGTVVDDVNASGSWPAGDNVTKETMQRSGTAWVTAAPTPRAVNPNQPTGSPSPVPGPSPGSPAPTPTLAPSQPVHPSLTVAAGEDRSVTVGSVTLFSGAALGIKNEPLEDAYFWWNFGDGGAREGRNVTHTFAVPGTYTVGLHVSSGSYAGSDFLRLAVLLNSVGVDSVQEGVDGFVLLKNPSPVDVDIGSWTMTDALGISFVVPPKTVIGRGSTVAFPNSTTGLLLSSASLPLLVRYPNGAVAFVFNLLPGEHPREFAVESEVTPLASVANEVSGVPNTAQESVSLRPVPPDVRSDVERSMMNSTSSLPDIAVTTAMSPANGEEDEKNIALVGKSGQQRTALFFATAIFVSVVAAVTFLFTRRHA